VPSIVFLRIIF